MSSIYRDDVAFDLYIQAALEEECDSSDEDLNELTREIERLTAELKITDCSNPFGCRRQASFDEWHAKTTAEIARLEREAGSYRVQIEALRDEKVTLQKKLDVYLSQEKR